MDELKTMFDLLGTGQKKDFWQLDQNDELNPERAAWVLVFGCPNGAGAYLQALFDVDRSLIGAEVINTDGDPCSCEWCVPSKKRPRPKLCKKHPEYQAKRAPRAGCRECLRAWRER